MEVSQGRPPTCAEFYVTEPKQTPLSTRGRGKTGMQTPATSAKPAGGLPFITPKFNTATPLHRTAMRVPKPDEVALSLNGSPLYLSATAARGRGRGKTRKDSEPDAVPFKLRDGNTLMIPAKSPTDSAAPVDLDDSEKRRLMAVKLQIENLLNIRNEN